MSAEQRIRFGVFELDPASGELLKGGTKVRLQEQPFQVLKALLERPGQVVTREELRQLLWPDDTFVDFEDGLSTAVKKVRQALGDSAANPRFIETLPKRGYRFIAPVTTAQASATEPTPEGSLAETPPKAAPRRRRLAFAALAASAATIAFLFAVNFGGRRGEGPVVKFVLAPGEDIHDPVISPDGRYVAFVTFEEGGALWIRELSEEEPRRVPDSEGARRPFWSPDSRHVAFGTGDILKRIEVDGDGKPLEICKVPASRYRGGVWSPFEDAIYFANLGNIARVRPSGDNLERLDSPTHRFGSDPILLPIPDRRIILLHAEDHHGEPEGLWALDLDSGTKHRVGPGRSPAYSATGHILYQEDTPAPRVRAVTFSLETLKADGDPFVVGESAAAPSVSTDGTLVYLSGSVGSWKRVVWRDRSGALLGVASEPLKTPSYLDLSPSGDAAAVTAVVGEDREIWIVDLATPNAGPRRLTFNSWREGFILWSPEGRRIAYRYREPGEEQTHLVIQPAAGGEIEHLAADGIPNDWWGDGETEYLLFAKSGGGGIGYGQAPAGGDFEFKRFTEEPSWGSQLSPDGRFLTYMSGPRNTQIVARSFPDGNGPWQVSRPGERAVAPRWNPNGKEIFYAVGDQLVAAAVTTEPVFRVEKRTNLFRSECFLASVGQHYDVAADGERFLLLEAVAEDKPTLRVTQNWFAEFIDR